MEITMEDRFDFEGLLRFDVEDDDCALLVDGNEERFAHGESVAGVENGGGFGAHGECAGQRFRWENAAFGEKIQMEFTKDFQRIDPGFHFAAFVSKQGGALAGDGKKFPGAHGAREFNRRRGFVFLLG